MSRRGQNRSPESLAKRRRQSREWKREKMSDPEYRAHHNALRTNPRMERRARVPLAVIREVRVRTVLAGRSPAVSSHLMVTCTEMALERPELTEEYFHFPSLSNKTSRWAHTWRTDLSDESKASILAEAEELRIKVN